MAGAHFLPRPRLTIVLPNNSSPMNNDFRRIGGQSFTPSNRAKADYTVNSSGTWRVDFFGKTDIFCPVRWFFAEPSPDKMDTNAKEQQPETNGVANSRKELLELHERVLERVRKMTPKEGFQSLIASGIYTPDGNLAKEYGG